MIFVGNAMNTIPLTFDEHQIDCTVVGGATENSEKTLNISVILLNTTGCHFKVQLFENLLSCNFKQIISVEHDANNFSLDDFFKKFPTIKFIVPLEKATDGEMINLAMSEVSSDYVLVLRDNLAIPQGVILSNLAEKLTQSGNYCIVPRLFDINHNSLDIQFSPFVEKNHFTIESSNAVSDGMKTLYPFDYIGLYNRKKFIQLGGFDYTIKSSYWQNLDLAMRAWLFGEEIKITTILQFTYSQDYQIEDKTLNIDYLRFHLKNESPKYKNERGVLRKSQFFPFFFHSSCGFLEAKRLFSAAKKWVEINKYKFKLDLQNLIVKWSVR